MPPFHSIPFPISLMWHYLHHYSRRQHAALLPGRVRDCSSSGRSSSERPARATAARSQNYSSAPSAVERVASVAPSGAATIYRQWQCLDNASISSQWHICCSRCLPYKSQAISHKAKGQGKVKRRGRGRGERLEKKTARCTADCSAH